MRVIKAGISDTFQDGGRPGFAHLGVGHGGCMDLVAGRIANLLLGNDENSAVLEMHFPGPVLHFEKSVSIALAGGDFFAMADGHPVPIHRRICLPANSRIEFKKKVWGQRCYLAIKNGWELNPVMGSYSTHLKAGFGGWKGRALKAGDEIKVRQREGKESAYASTVSNIQFEKWYVDTGIHYLPGPTRVIPGPEWDWLTMEGQKCVLNELFTISRQSDRMGYQLSSPTIEKSAQRELLSSSVLPGTIQLLPNGQPLLLMADAQTTGGYPRILQVAAVDLPKLAQMGPGEKFEFELTSISDAAEKWNDLQQWLLLLKRSNQLNNQHKNE